MIPDIFCSSVDRKNASSLMQTLNGKMDMKFMDERLWECSKIYKLTRKHKNELKNMEDMKEKEFGFMKVYDRLMMDHEKM